MKEYLFKLLNKKIFEIIYNYILIIKMDLLLTYYIIHLFIT